MTNRSSTTTDLRPERAITPLGVLLAVIMGAAGSLAMSTSCKVETGGDSDGGEGSTGGSNMCNCPSGTAYGQCKCSDGYSETNCLIVADCAPASFCAAHGLGGTWTGMSCAQYPDDTTVNCATWSPSSNVSLVSGVYRVGKTWFANVVAHPAPTWTCDDAYVALNANGTMEIKLASSGELLYVLGLRNGDKPVSINGMPLNDFVDGWDAFLGLYKTGVINYTLVVHRGTSNITLTYKLV